MVINIRFHTVAYNRLVAKELLVFFIRFSINIEFDESIIMYRNHIIESQHSQSSIIQFQNMLAGLYVDMIGLGRLHWDEIPKSTNMKHNTNIGSPVPFVKLHFAVATV